jgi:hypothetical protein
MPSSRTRIRFGAVSRNRDGRSTARFVERCERWLPGRLNRRSLRSDSVFVAGSAAGREQSLRRLEWSGVVGQGDEAERKRAKSLRGIGWGNDPHIKVTLNSLKIASERHGIKTPLLFCGSQVLTPLR